MKGSRTLFGTGAILSLAFGMAACAPQQPATQPVAVTQTQTAPEYWDPKAPGRVRTGAATTGAAAGAGGDWDDDWDNGDG